MRVRCDVVKCEYNDNCNCCAEVIDIVLNHIGDLEYIECQTRKEENYESKTTSKV